MTRRQLSLIAVITLSIVVASCVPPQRLLRHSAEHRFNGEQIAFDTGTAGGNGGNLIYSKTVQLPPNEKTMFVTISTTGDAHRGSSHWFSAKVNGALCNSEGGGAANTPDGWIPLQKHFDYENVSYFADGTGGQTSGGGGGGTGDMHDNGIYYTWCCVEGVRPGNNNTVELRMATSSASEPVFIERSHFYIDSVQVKLCNSASPVEAAAMPEAMREKARQQTSQ